MKRRILALILVLILIGFLALTILQFNQTIQSGGADLSASLMARSRDAGLTAVHDFDLTLTAQP